MSLVLCAVLVYVGLQLALGFWVSRRVSSQADYLLGGRSLGLTLCTASMFATWFGAETCVGAAGEVYAHGIGAVSADPFGYGVCLILFGVFVAAELRRRGYTTLADLFGERFSGGVERLVAIMMVPGSVLWAAAQIRAFGGVFAAAGDGLDPTLGIALAAAITIAYTASGGLLADVYTDLLQGVVLVATLVVLALVVFSASGAAPDVFASAGSPGGETTSSRLAALDGWAVPIAGSLFTQEIISRAVASKSPEVARRSAILGGIIYLVVGALPVLLGLVARELLPGTGEAEQVLPLLSRHVFGELGFVLLAGTLISAILSTVDSALLACGAFIVHNVIGQRAAALSDAAKLRVTRLSVAGLGGVAFVFAILGESVHALVVESGALGSSGIFVAALLGLFTRYGGARAALASLLLGAVTYVYTKHVLESDTAYLWSLSGALAGYVAGASLGERVAEKSAGSAG